MQWFTKKILLLCLYAVVICASVLLTLVAVHQFAADAGYNYVISYEYLGFIMAMIFLNALFASVMLILVNLLTLRFGAMRSFIAVALFHLFSLFICIGLPQGLKGVAVYFIPAIQGLFAWHDMSSFLGGQAFDALSQCMVFGFRLSFSYAYLIAFGAIEATIGMLWIKRIDLL